MRFFSERGIEFHFRDVVEKPLAAGEIENICRSIAIEDLIDTSSTRYNKRGLAHMIFDARGEIADDPLLLRLPIVRNGREATIGYAPSDWERWIKDG